MRGRIILVTATAWLLASCGVPKDRAWALPEYQYYDQRGYLSITGTLMGDDVGYKNNTWKIICVYGEETCTVAEVEEIGRDQLGEIDIGKWEVTNYNAQSITLDNQDPTACGHPIIIINRVAKTVNYTNSPQNQDKEWCKKYNEFVKQKTAKTLNWRIGDPKKPWEK
jgi:hypothetical protein